MPSREKRETEYLSIQGIADILGCSYYYARNTVLPQMAYVKIGRHIMVREEEFRRFMQRKERESKASV